MKKKDIPLYSWECLKRLQASPELLKVTQHVFRQSWGLGCFVFFLRRIEPEEMETKQWKELQKIFAKCKIYYSDPYSLQGNSKRSSSRVKTLEDILQKTILCWHWHWLHDLMLGFFPPISNVYYFKLNKNYLTGFMQFTS